MEQRIRTEFAIEWEWTGDSFRKDRKGKAVFIINGNKLNPNNPIELSTYEQADQIKQMLMESFRIGVKTLSPNAELSSQ